MKRFRMKAYLLLTLILGVLILPGCGGDAGNGHWDQPGTPLLGTLAPTITDTFPANLDENIAIDVVLSATFSKPMNPLTMIDANFTLQASGPPLGAVLPVTVVYDEIAQKATFTPNVPLDPDTFYTVMVTADAKDSDGKILVVPAVNGLPVPNPWTFKTAPAISDVIIPGATCLVATGATIPTVTQSNPTSGNQLATTSTTGVPNNGKLITATFSLEMDSTTIESVTAPLTFTIKETNGDSVAGTVTMDATKKIATFTTDAALSPGIEYTASITTAAESADGTAIACPYEWNFTTVFPAAAGLAPVNMAGIESFGVLGGLSVTLGGGPASTTGYRVDGDVGISPGSTCDGCDNTTVSGVILLATDAADAKLALVEAYDDAIGRTVDVCTLASADLSTGPTAACDLGGGGTFEPGLYWSSTDISIPVDGTITLDALGDPNAVFIFQSESTIITNTNSHVILAGMANANNVFWVGKTSATIGGPGADFAGTVLVLSNFTVNGDTQMLGRALARNGAVTVQDLALITVPTP